MVARHATGVAKDQTRLSTFSAQTSEFARATAAAWRSYYPGEVHDNAPVLSSAEEQALAQRVAEGDQQARSRLIEANHRLVFHVVSAFRRSGVPIEDLIQEGNLGLIEAVDRFDLHRGCRFNTYAILWIRGAVLRAALRQRTLVDVPERTAQAAARARKSHDELAAKLRREPSNAEVAARCGLSERQVDDLLRHVPTPGSLETLDAVDSTTPDEWLYTTEQRNPLDSIALQELHNHLLEGLKHLTEREREVIYLRYGLNDDEPHSLADVGRMLSISRQRARELEQNGLRRLRHLPQFAQI